MIINYSVNTKPKSITNWKKINNFQFCGFYWFDKAKVYKINTNEKLSNGKTRIELYNERFKLSENLKPVLNQILTVIRILRIGSYLSGRTVI